MNFRRRIRTEPMGFQIIPIIDVILLLLIFFVSTWTYAQWETELNITVPTAKEVTKSRRMPGEIIINVNKDGEVVLNKKNLTEEELRSVLVRIAKQFPDQPVIVRGDEATQYKAIIRVLDACRQADIWNVAFATKPPEQPAPAATPAGR
ncbi:MAG: biopolymer transporter ExbD [Verrucomicrobia bacterium]|nr:biopolymer transporter ExbD [Verrucomicrobiota bacterium]